MTNTTFAPAPFTFAPGDDATQEAEFFARLFAAGAAGLSFLDADRVVTTALRAYLAAVPVQAPLF